jgi:hypothetical protein
MERLALVLIANNKLYYQQLENSTASLPVPLGCIRCKALRSRKKRNLKEPNSALLNLKSAQGEKLNWGKMLLFGKSPRGV